MNILTVGYIDEQGQWVVQRVPEAQVPALKERVNFFVLVRTGFRLHWLDEGLPELPQGTELVTWEVQASALPPRPDAALPPEATDAAPAEPTASTSPSTSPFSDPFSDRYHKLTVGYVNEAGQWVVWRLPQPEVTALKGRVHLFVLVRTGFQLHWLAGTEVPAGTEVVTWEVQEAALPARPDAARPPGAPTAGPDPAEPSATPKPRRRWVGLGVAGIGVAGLVFLAVRWMRERATRRAYAAYLESPAWKAIEAARAQADQPASGEADREAIRQARRQRREERRAGKIGARRRNRIAEIRHLLRQGQASRQMVEELQQLRAGEKSRQDLRP